MRRSAKGSIGIVFKRRLIVISLTMIENSNTCVLLEYVFI